MKKNTLYLIRGIPGSGKSTEAQRILSGDSTSQIKWFEADMFFVNDRGEYLFDPSKLHKAHKWCLDKTEKALSEGFNVIVSNTFSTLQELKPYQSLASKFGAYVNMRQMNNSFKSIHNVPELIIEKMQDRWQHVPECVYVPPVNLN